MHTEAWTLRLLLSPQCSCQLAKKCKGSHGQHEEVAPKRLPVLSRGCCGIKALGTPDSQVGLVSCQEALHGFYAGLLQRLRVALPLPGCSQHCRTQALGVRKRDCTGWLGCQGLLGRAPAGVPAHDHGLEDMQRS